MLDWFIKYLTNKNWVLQQEGERWMFFKPPKELGFESDYTLPVPKMSEANDFKEVLRDTIKLVTKLYKAVH